MAESLTAGQALAAAESTGHKVVQLSGWAHHNRGNRGSGWGPLNGVMIHHTGSDTSSPASYAKTILHDGYAGLPGPLCQFGIDSNGAIYMIGWGRANHAGAGDDRVLDRVMKEDPALMREEANPTSRGTDGNSRFYGIEVMYSGGRPMSAAQRDATVALAAALCNAHGWGAASVISHREWTSTKWDPGHEDMVSMRRDIANQQKYPTTTNGAEMQLTDTIISKDNDKVTVAEVLRMALVTKIEAAAATAQLRLVVAELEKVNRKLDELAREDVKL